jgi:hypothetical protein
MLFAHRQGFIAIYSLHTFSALVGTTMAVKIPGRYRLGVKVG